MATANTEPLLQPRPMRGMYALAWLFASLAVSGVTRSARAEEFTDQIRPFLRAHCLRCHSAQEQEGGLDLERFTSVVHVRDEVEPWENIVEMLEDGEMPPQGEPRPPLAEQKRVIAWIRALLDDEADLRAGDPGPIVVRRLNNSEYRYTVRDLTGVDLRPEREFPTDGAAGEGFLNATDVLTISPDLLDKYLDAAKKVAAHAVLLPGGFRFSPSEFKEDWVNEARSRILALYAKYTNDVGEIPLGRYLKVTVAHRDAILSGSDSLSEAAKRNQLSTRYLKRLWGILTDDSGSLFLDEVQAEWRAATPDDLSKLIERIVSLQGLLWHKRTPDEKHALDDRYIPAAVTLANRATYRFEVPKIVETSSEKEDGGESVVFYIAVRTEFGRAERTRVVLQNPRFESGEESPISLRDALAKAETPKKGTAVVEGFRRLDPTEFGRDLSVKDFAPTDLLLDGSAALEIELSGSLVSGRTFVVDARLDVDLSPDTLVRLFIQKDPKLPKFERGLGWRYREPSAERKLLIVRDDDVLRAQITRAAEEFRRRFPARVVYPGLIVRDAAVTLERFHRADAPLSQLMLTLAEERRLDQLWQELHFVSGDALQVWNSLSLLTKGEMAPYDHLRPELKRRAEETRQNRLNAEPRHLDALLDFAARAFRRPLEHQEQLSLRDLYHSLREQKLPHDEAFRAVLARVFVSPQFLYRIERPAEGEIPVPVSDRELATRLSYFLWSSLPDAKLRQTASAGRLRDPAVLTQQVRRMLQHPHVRSLAIEFGTQWLEVRGFDKFQAKNQELFPTFDESLRRAAYEESIALFEDLFRADRSIWKLIDADHTFLNETLATHYAIPGIEGDHFRRVDGVKANGRGGVLGLASVLAKHSGASRTSPVLRGNWVAETLLGERLPRPPDGVPELPEGDDADGLTIRQIVETHAEREECAVCHQKIDPLGFALERYDTIGRVRSTERGGRAVDAKAQLKDGTEFDGIDGLRNYLLTDRKSDLVRQFCRKLLGFALGRRVILSDRKLLEEMGAALEANDGRVSAAILAIVQSRQFRYIRGSKTIKRRRL